MDLEDEEAVEKMKIWAFQVIKNAHLSLATKSCKQFASG